MILEISYTFIYIISLDKRWGLLFEKRDLFVENASDMS